MKKKPLNESGIVSMLSMIIFSIIITIVATAYLQNVNSQQKNALNYDLGTRAYYSAESGAQDAIRGLKSDATLLANGQNSCKKSTTPPNFIGGTGSFGGNLGYTCQIIDTKPTAIEGDTSTPKTIKLEFAPVGGVSNYIVTLKWSKDDQKVARHDDSKLFFDTASWREPSDEGKSYHPLLKAGLITTPTSNFNRDAIKQSIYFLNPTDVAGSQIPVADMSASTQLPDQVVQNANCDPDSSPYFCTAEFRVSASNFSSKQFFIRLASLYGVTNFQISARAEDSSSNLELLNSQVTVDVTGKASNVYRRIKQSFPIENSFSASPFPDAAIVAGDGICKQFNVGTTVNAYRSFCTP